MTAQTPQPAPPVRRDQRDKRFSWQTTFTSLRDRAEQDPRTAQPCGHGCITGTSPDGSQRVIMPIRCGRWSCPTCARRKVRMWQSRAVRGSAERLLTLTIRPRPGVSKVDLLELAKSKLPRLIAAIRRAYPRIEYMAAWQLTAAGVAHAHLMTRGSYIPQRWLSARWRHLTDSPVVDIRKIHNARQAARYVTRYMLRDVSRNAWIFEGRRVITMSRGWIPDQGQAPPNPDWQGWHWKYDPRYLADILADWKAAVNEPVATTEDETAILFSVRARYLLPLGGPPPPKTTPQTTLFSVPV